jgi:hypothetical protein
LFAALFTATVEQQVAGGFAQVGGGGGVGDFLDWVALDVEEGHLREVVRQRAFAPDQTQKPPDVGLVVFHQPDKGIVSCHDGFHQYTSTRGPQKVA